MSMGIVLESTNKKGNLSETASEGKKTKLDEQLKAFLLLGARILNICLSRKRANLWIFIADYVEQWID